MEVFNNKKSTLIRTICFMAFFVAINVICALLSLYVPLFSIILIIFLPLTSAVVEINCKDRWFPIYALATIGLSVVVTLSQIDFTIFYIVPSIFTGYIFGLVSKKKLPDMFAIFLATAIQSILSFVSIQIIDAIGNTDLLDFIAKILRISSRFWFNTLFVLGLFLVSLIQVILSFIVVDNELRKLKLKEDDKNDYSMIANLGSILFLIVAIGFAFFSLKFALLFEAFSFYFAVFSVIFHFKKNEKILIIFDAVSILVTIFVYAFMYKLFKSGTDLMLFLTIPFIISISSILHYFLKKSKQ